MNWDAIGAVAELVAAVGVIISLLFVGMQAQPAAALPAGLDVDGEYALEALGPEHRLVPIDGRCLATLSDSACAGHNLCPVGARRCEHAVITGQVRAGLRHQRSESRDEVLRFGSKAEGRFGCRTTPCNACNSGAA